jgi:cell division protein FtsB
MNLTNLIPGVAQIKTILTIAGVVIVIGLLVGGGIWIKIKLDEIAHLQKVNAVLTVNNKTLSDNNAVLNNNIKRLESTNSTNQTTIDSLLKERQASESVIKILAREKKMSDKIIVDLHKKLVILEKNPKNDGPLAPVLRDTIQGIEASEK